MTVIRTNIVLLALAMLVTTQGCGTDDQKVAMKAVKADKLGGRLQDVALSQAKEGVWDIKGKNKAGAECTGTVEKPKNANDPWPVTVKCPKSKKKKEDPTGGAFAGCEAGDNAACEKLHELGMTNDKERDDFEAALTYFELACSKQIDDACGMACVYHHGERKGVGIAQDLTKAVDYCKQACDANVDGGCTTLSVILEKEGKTEEALKVAKKACEEARDGEACMRAGMIVRISSPERAANPDLAIEFHRKGCSHSWPDACVAWGDALKKRGNKGDDREASRAYDRGCQLGDKEACTSAN